MQAATIAIAAAVAAIATPLAAYLLTRSLADAEPLERGAHGGAIAPDRRTAAAVVVLSAAMCGFGLWTLAAGDIAPQWVGVCLAALGLIVVIFMSPSLTGLQAVRWSATGVEGPSSLFGLTLGLARTFIPWSEIDDVGGTVTGYVFVKAEDGRRIYWSEYYRGHRRLGEALVANCPQLLE